MAHSHFLTCRRSTVPVSLLTAIAREASHKLSDNDEIDYDSGSSTRRLYSNAINEQIAALANTHDVKSIGRQNASEHLFPQGCRLFLPDSESDSANHSSTDSVYIDLTPRPVMAAGLLMDLLVRTNVGHYVDFRPVDGLYQHFPHPIGTQRTPATRSAVFTHKLVSPIEKRLLTRFLKGILAEKESETKNVSTDSLSSSTCSSKEDSFSAVMANARLTARLQEFLHHSVLFSATDQNITESEGRRRIHRFHDGMMRFGTRSPFLYPNYGGGEIPQAFCRLCAVHGGVQVLRRGAAAVAFKRPDAVGGSDNRKPPGHNVVVVTTENDLVQTKHVFISNAFRFEATESSRSDLMSKEIATQHEWPVWRFSGVVDGSVMSEEEPSRIMICFPRGSAGNHGSDVWVRQVDSSVAVCRQGQLVLYAETIEKSGTENDVLACVHSLSDWSSIKHESSHLFEENSEKDNDFSKKTSGSECIARRKPRLLWGMTFVRNGEVETPAQHINGVDFVSPSEVEIDSDSVVAEAERCFRTVFGKEATFLPKIDTDYSETEKLDEVGRPNSNNEANKEEDDKT